MVWLRKELWCCRIAPRGEVQDFGDDAGSGVHVVQATEDLVLSCHRRDLLVDCVAIELTSRKRRQCDEIDGVDEASFMVGLHENFRHEPGTAALHAPLRERHCLPTEAMVLCCMSAATNTG